MELPTGCASANRRVSYGRIDLPFAIWRKHFYAYTRCASGDAVECAGCDGTAEDGDSVRRSGALPGAQAAVPGDVWAGSLSGARVRDSVWQGQGGARGERPHRGDVRGAGSAWVAGGG